MSEEKRIREQYGLTQPELATYLDVALSLLKLAETAARSPAIWSGKGREMLAVEYQ